MLERIIGDSSTLVIIDWINWGSSSSSSSSISSSSSSGSCSSSSCSSSCSYSSSSCCCTISTFVVVLGASVITSTWLEKTCTTDETGCLAKTGGLATTWTILDKTCGFCVFCTIGLLGFITIGLTVVKTGGFVSITVLTIGCGVVFGGSKKHFFK